MAADLLTRSSTTSARTSANASIAGCVSIASARHLMGSLHLRRPSPAWLGRVLALTVTGMIVALSASPARAQDVLEFPDWTAVSANVATGTLLGHTITLSGSQVSDPPASIVDGTSSLFAGPYFTPPLPRSDAIEFRANNSSAIPSYTLNFGAPTTGPVLHLGSLGSTLQFPPGTSITRISGRDDGFAVSGSTVTGAPNNTVDSNGENDSNGTVRLNGTFQSISFTASTSFALDGIYLQVGAPEPSPTVGTPAHDHALRRYTAAAPGRHPARAHIRAHGRWLDAGVGQGLWRR
jgi:hypothetical protein